MMVGDTVVSVMLPPLPLPPMTNWSELLPPTDTLTVCPTVKQEAGTVARSSLELTKGAALLDFGILWV
jgi:hypothetical protein